jgi:hypothetical protein
MRRSVKAGGNDVHRKFCLLQALNREMALNQPTQAMGFEQAAGAAQKVDGAAQR